MAHHNTAIRTVQGSTLLSDGKEYAKSSTNSPPELSEIYKCNKSLSSPQTFRHLGTPIASSLSFAFGTWGPPRAIATATEPISKYGQMYSKAG